MGDDGLQKLQHPDARQMDFYAVQGEAEKDAKKILRSVIEFYFDAKMIRENDYLRFKRRVDEMTISSIMFSLKTTQHAIIKALQEVDMGNVHPRLLEVLATLQNQLMVTVKHQASYMLTMEEGYKKVKEDQQVVDKERGAEDAPSEVIGSKINKRVRGTKALILQLRQDATPDFPKRDDNETPRLTDPHYRPDSQYNAPSSDATDEDPGVDELF